MEYLELKYKTIKIYGEPSPGKKCIIESRVHGLFATFYCILYGLYICEKESMTPIINIGKDHLYYDPSKGENIFDYFYGQDDSTIDSQHCRIVVFHPYLFLFWCRNSLKEKRMAHSLINKYFRLNSIIETELKLFSEKKMRGKRVLGVHYRGRDKISETPIVPFEEYEIKIKNILEGNLCDKFLFVTDEFGLRRKMAKEYPDKIILYDLEADYRAADNDMKSGLHFLNTGTHYLMAKDALMECYLLSYCDLFMSSIHSSMSLFVTFINPDIPHIILEP